MTCREDGCRARIEWELDLRALPVRPLSEESLALFTGGNRFVTTLPDAGTRVTFRLLTGADERKLPALRKNAGDRVLSAMLAYRITDLAGVADTDRRRFLEDLSMRDADHLLGEFDRVDCGVDTLIEVECPECFARQDVELPFDRSFFLPRTKRTKQARQPSSPA